MLQTTGNTRETFSISDLPREKQNELVGLITRLVVQELAGIRGQTAGPASPTVTVSTAAAQAQPEMAAPAQEDWLIPLAVSNRHVHLAEQELIALFGPGYQLHRERDLSQPGQYACKETVTLVGPKGVIEKVRVLGPLRSRTQVEISISDCFKLGVRAPLRDSGDLAGSAPITLVGPAGAVTIPEGCIIAARHIHMSPADARRFGVQDKDKVYVRARGPRAVTFAEVLVRVHDSFRLEMHVDMDEANAVGLQNGDRVEIVPPHRLGERKVPGGC